MERTKFQLQDIFKVCFPVAAVWIGTQVGPALAAGTTAANYFARFGSWGLWSAFISQIACGVLIFFGSELGRVMKCRDYKTGSQMALGRLGRVDWFWKIYMVIRDILTLVALCLTSGLMFNMMGQVLMNIFGISISTACIVCAAIFIFCVMWGIDFLKKLSSGITIALVVCFILIFAIGWALTHENAVHFLTAWDTLGTSGSAAFAMCWAYIGIQYGFAGTCCMYNKDFTSWKHSFWMAVVGVLFNCFFLALSILNVWCFYPDSLTFDAPHLSIILEYYSKIAPWMKWIYYITMILASVSTAVGAIVSLVVRWKPVIFKKGGPLGDVPDVWQQASLSTVLMVVCIAISFLGMTTIMSTYYSKVGTVNLWLGLLPYLVTWPVIYFSMGAKKREELAAMPELEDRVEAQGAATENGKEI